jgi:acyl dehydratase
VQERFAQLVGMPRGYGYGASMGAWVLDTLAGWAGEWGEIVHSDMQYRSPALTGDVTYLNAEVVELEPERTTDQLLATLRVVMTNQRDEVMASGRAELRLPTERLPAR